MTTVPEPLSADLMTMSLRLLSSLQALITALVSSWMLWLSRLQYLLVADLRLRRRLCLCVGDGWLIAVMTGSCVGRTWTSLADVVTGECRRLTVDCSRLRERLSWLELLWRVQAEVREAHSPAEYSFLRCLAWSSRNSSAAESWRKCLIWLKVEEEHVDLSSSKVSLNSDLNSLKFFWHSVLRRLISLWDVLVNNLVHW